MSAELNSDKNNESEFRDLAVSRGVDLNRVPKHIAFIMDGNGRWAQRQNLPRLIGHQHGYQIIHPLINNCSDIGVEYVTLYAFSAENWRRPNDEVKGLMELIEAATKAEMDGLIAEGVRLTVSGDLSLVPQSLRDTLSQAKTETGKNYKITVNLAINYGGRSEITQMVKQISQSVKNGEIMPDEINEELISNNLYTANMPDPDLLVRTAGEMRVSNFLLWQIAYAEFYVTDTLWPDFKEDALIDAMLNYQNRVRKFGGVVKG